MKVAIYYSSVLFPVLPYFQRRAVVRLLKALNPLFVSGGYGNCIEELGKESRLPLKANKIDDCVLPDEFVSPLDQCQ